MIVELADLKMHLRVDSADEDRLIQSLGDAAELQIANWIGRPIYASSADLPGADDLKFDSNQIVANAAIIVAIKMTVDALYKNREGDGDTVSDAVPSTTVRALLSGYRVFSQDEITDENR